METIKAACDALQDHFKNSNNLTAPETGRLYREWADSLTQPIQDILEDSNIRKSISVINLAHGQKIEEPKVRYLNGYTATDLTDSGEVKYITIQTSNYINVKKFDYVATRTLIENIAKAIISWEEDAINLARQLSGSNDIVLYIHQPFQCYEDPMVLARRKKIGIYGWERFSVVVR